MGIERLQTDRPAKRWKSLRYHIHCDGLQWPAFIFPTPHSLLISETYLFAPTKVSERIASLYYWVSEREM